MDKQKFKRVVNDLKEYKGVEEVFLLNPQGEIIFKSVDFDLNENETKTIFKAWKEKRSSLIYQNNRFVILKNEEIQLAAKNVGERKGNIAGSITKEGDYLIIHTAENTGIILLEWSILVNKIAWS